MQDMKDLLRGVEKVVIEAATAVESRFDINSRPKTRGDIINQIRENDALSMKIMRDGFDAIRPQAQMLDDEIGTGSLPAGEFWIVDPVEGAINQIHGMPDWCVSAALVRDNQIILATVHVPLLKHTYSAILGQGAWLNNAPLSVSDKTEIGIAMVGTGQAAPGESVQVHKAIGASVSAVLQKALTVRVSVPATLQLIQVAAGRMDGFWQFSQVRSGLSAGALLVREAGGMVTDFDGNLWSFESPEFLATTPHFSSTLAKSLRDIG